MPTVSVIMAAWNNGDYLSEAVGSILDQTLVDIEVVLVDNNSTDGSVERLLAARPDPRIKLLRQTVNLGIAAGLNVGIGAAAGRFIAIMDCDDRAVPQRLELQVRALETDPTLDVVGTGARWMDEAGRTGAAFPLFHEEEEIHRYLPYGMPLLHPSLLGRAEVFRAVPYRAELSQTSDYDWASRAAERHRFGSLALPLLHYRNHPGSTTIRHPERGQLFASVVRLLTARRRAGRPEHLAELTAECQRLLAAGIGRPAGLIHYARRFLAEGFALQAAYHAALAVRHGGGWAGRWLYLRAVLAAVRTDRGSWREALAALPKAPFWVLLRRAGFPDFPRY